MINSRSNPQYIEIGHINGSHGLHGALLIHSETRPIANIGNYTQWWLGTTAENASPYEVERCWNHSQKLLAKLEKVANRTDADTLRNLRIFIPPDVIEEENEAFLWHDLISCTVNTASGTTIGSICRIEEYGSSDILIVTDSNKGGEWMIPFTASIITDIDLNNQTVTVDLPDGMEACFSPNC